MRGSIPATPNPVPERRPRLPRAVPRASDLALLRRDLGRALGPLGAATFIPLRGDNVVAYRAAAPLAVVSAIGAFLSFLGMLAGQRLR